ncbi:MAG: response regulator [Treponema sp.]|jgi:CheY-like chemotaxis protein|nr:response regulator [Treponema sp.]
MITNKEQKNSLLIVDDESVNLKILSHILGTEYTIYTATNGKKAIEKAKEYKPDLILLDVMMPEMDGYKTLSEIKKHEDIKKIPVIFVSGLSSNEDEEKGLALEAVDYITKPFSAPIVLLRVRNQIQLIRMYRDLEIAVRKAETANHSKSVFLAKTSDEIRTPLNAILGISEIQLNKDSLVQDTKDAFAKIFYSGSLLLGIIEDILDSFKIEEGKLEITPEQYDFESMISDIVFMNVFKYEKKPVEFIVDVDKNIPSVLVGDKIRIKQILNNLLSNAFKFITTGKIEMSVTLEDGEAHTKAGKKDGGFVTLVFKVRDTGQGMPEEQLEKLFDGYYSFNMETGRVSEGTGIGMNILYNLSHMMGGDILVESEFGKGSMFTVRLPQGITGAPVLGKEAVDRLRQLRSNYELKMKEAHIVREPLPAGKALVVDDIEINLYVVREMLLPYGLQVDTALSGAEAIGKLKQNDYDIVFMDHVMPVMDGVETTRQIRKMGQKYEKIPIIALTANIVFSEKDMFFANGFSGFISKPLSMHELDEVLRKWMGHKMAKTG